MRLEIQLSHAFFGRYVAAAILKKINELVEPTKQFLPIRDLHCDVDAILVQKSPAVANVSLAGSAFPHSPVRLDLDFYLFGVTLDLDAHIEAGAVVIVATIVNKDQSLASFPPALRAQVPDSFPQRVDLAPVLKGLGIDPAQAAFKPSMASLSTHSDAKCVALRIELGAIPASDVDSWRSFLGHTFDARAALRGQTARDPEWAIDLDWELLKPFVRGVLETEIDKALAKKEDSARKGDITLYWNLAHDAQPSGMDQKWPYGYRTEPCVAAYVPVRAQGHDGDLYVEVGFDMPKANTIHVEAYVKAYIPAQRDAFTALGFLLPILWWGATGWVEQEPVILDLPLADFPLGPSHLQPTSLHTNARGFQLAGIIDPRLTKQLPNAEGLTWSAFAYGMRDICNPGAYGQMATVTVPPPKPGVFPLRARVIVDDVPEARVIYDPPTNADGLAVAPFSAIIFIPASATLSSDHTTARLETQVGGTTPVTLPFDSPPDPLEIAATLQESARICKLIHEIKYKPKQWVRPPVGPNWIHVEDIIVHHPGSDGPSFTGQPSIQRVLVGRDQVARVLEHGKTRLTALNEHSSRLTRTTLQRATQLEAMSRSEQREDCATVEKHEVFQKIDGAAAS